MRLRTLRIERLPGIQPGFTLDELAPGVNVVVGPNAVGKSSLVRALRAALYRDELHDAGVHVEATFDDEVSGDPVTALRIGASLQWRRAGQPAEAPPLPEHRFLPCYTLGVEDLLDDAHATDTVVAERLARELAGGYNLRAVRRGFPFGLKQTHGRSEAQALQDADRILRERQREREALVQDEARLGELRERKAAAREAHHEAERLDRALELLTERRNRRRLERQLADFPDGMARLRGDEADEVERLREQLRARRSERQRATERRGAAIEALTQSGLAEAELDETALADRRRRVDRLRQTETQRDHKRTELTQAQAALESAVVALGGEPEQAVHLDPKTIERVEAELESKRSLDAERRRLTSELEQLPETDDDAADPEPLRTARRELLQWLAAPRRPPWTAGRILAAVALLGASGAGIGALATALHLGWLALLVPLAAGAIGLGLPGQGERVRRTVEQRFGASGHAPPDAWRTDEVTARLEALDRAVVEAEDRVRARQRRRELERTLAARDEALGSIHERLRSVATDVGFDPHHLDASFQRWLRLVAEWDQARRHAAAVADEHQGLKREADTLRAEVLAFIDGFGFRPDATAADADTLADRLDRLSERVRQRDDARRDIDSADREITRLDHAIEAVHQQIRRLFERAGLEPDDDDTLRRRLDRFDAWQRLRDELHDVCSREADREQRLGERDDLIERVDNDDEEGLQRERDTKREAAHALEGLIQEITRIEGDSERAGRERALEAARGAYQDAADALRDRLDEAYFAAAGQFLLEQVEAEHEQAVQPVALRQARDWFARFTRHQYELVFSAGDTARFTARETATGEHRRLAELSSGTRMQLLLAVRMAFARDAERGAYKLPLVLDEALTTADPERFRAAAQSLTLLAQEDARQVFYLTAQPADLAFWSEFDPAVQAIDLAAVRGRAAAIADAEALAPPERPAVPAPAGRSAADYGVALGVPPIDPWVEAEQTHVFHLVRDDLDLLHRLLELGIDRLGPLESLLASPAIGQALTDDTIARLRARAEGVRAWLAAWRHGRGRPIDRGALEAADMLSERMLDEVAQLAEAVGGDGARLIQRLVDGEVRNFRRHKREELERWLQEHGYITANAPLAPADIELRVAAALSGHLPLGVDASAEAHVLVGHLQGGMAAIPATAAAES